MLGSSIEIICSCVLYFREQYHVMSYQGDL